MKRNGEEVKESHIPHPERIGVALHVFACIPDQSLTMCQIVGVAHRDHRIIEKNVIGLIVDGDGAFLYISHPIIDITQYKHTKQNVPKMF
jgi:hypothetical protein